MVYCKVAISVFEEIKENKTSTTEDNVGQINNEIIKHHTRF